MPTPGTRLRGKDVSLRRSDEKEAIEHYFRLGGPSNPAAISAAAAGRCNKMTLRRRVQAHADAASAIAALARVKTAGRPPTMPAHLEASVARVAVEAWQNNDSLHREQLAAVYFSTARDNGIRFKVPVICYAQSSLCAATQRLKLHTLPQNKEGIPSYNTMRRFANRTGITVTRTISNKAAHRSIDEKEDNIRAYFKGGELTCTLEGVTHVFNAPGWESMLDLQCTPDGKTFRDCPERIINMDETILNGPESQRGGVGPKSCKSVSSSSAYTQDQVTAVCAFTYSGTLLPLYYIFKGTRARTNWMQYAHPTSAFICREDGFFMTEEILHDWMANIFSRHMSLQVDKENRVLVVMDRHTSRTPKVLKYFATLGMDSFISTAALSAILQLLDQLFGRVKKHFASKARAYSVAHGVNALDRTVRVKLWEESFFEFFPRGVPNGIPALLSAMGVLPPCMETAISNLRKENEMSSVRSDVLAADLTLVPERVFPKSLGKRRERLNGAADADGSDSSDAGSESEEEGTRRQRGRKVPMSFSMTGTEYEAWLALEDRKKEAEMQAKAEKSRLREEKRAAKAELEAKKRVAREENGGRLPRGWNPDAAKPAPAAGRGGGRGRGPAPGRGRGRGRASSAMGRGNGKKRTYVPDSRREAI